MENILKGEQSRAAFGYVLVAVLAYFLNIILAKTTKLTVTQTTFLAVYVIGNIVLYSFDMLFAKEAFVINGTLTPVSYMDFATRLQQLGISFFQKQFMRFLITVAIDTIVGLVLLKYAIEKLEALNILTQWKYRDYVVAVIVAAFTYILYLGTLRFQWAYQSDTSPMLDILVMAWLSILLILTASKPELLKTDLRWRFIYEP